MSRSAASHPAIGAFESRIGDPLFPCVGAKSAAAQRSIGYLMAGDLRAGDADVGMVHALQDFAARTPVDAVFTSRIALFPRTPRLDEVQFEQALWSRLQALHDLDVARHRWDPGVSSDPASPRFSLSIGGRAFYVIGLHPGASRPARRFHCAALVFNLHSQFETLRADGRYEKLRAAITDRDIAYSGSRNPMLSTHGVASEARQYSGRQLEADWQCPFSTRSPNPRDAA